MSTRGSSCRSGCERPGDSDPDVTGNRCGVRAHAARARSRSTGGARTIQSISTGAGDGAAAIALARLLRNGDLDRIFGTLIPGSYGPPANRRGGQVDHRPGASHLVPFSPRETNRGW
jgi:hypothetical protein